MSEEERNRIIVEALLQRTEARRKLALVSERLSGIGRKLLFLGESLAALDSKPSAGAVLKENLQLLDAETLDVLNRDKLLELIAERSAMETAIAGCTAKLQSYGAE